MMQEQTAKAVSKAAVQVSRILDEVCVVAETNEDAAEALRIKRQVGRVLAALLLGVMDPLYEEHPSLRPEGLR